MQPMRHLLRPRLLLTAVHRPFNVSSRSFTMSDSINRNPHPDFKKVEASRPEWEETPSFHYTKTADPNWKFGQGRNALRDEGKDNKHISIDPFAEDRSSVLNYKMLISAITPRPIAMLSTRSSDGKSENLAVFSFFNAFNHDPPTFVVGFACSVEEAKDSLRNLMESKEAVINIISEPMLEAANSTSINAPFGDAEWEVSGLTREYCCETVKCARVKEAVFSVEAKLNTIQEIDSKAQPGKKSGTMAILEGTRFWVREDAVNDDLSLVDPAILRPMSRMGGITYSRSTQGVELTRPKFDEDLGGQEAFDKLKANKQ